MAAPATVIEAGTSIGGNLQGSEDVLVCGNLSGSVRLDGDLTIEGDAQVQANLEIRSLLVNGILVGNARASDTIELTATARVVGDLSAPRIIIADGAGYSGFIDMGDVEGSGGSSRSPAPPAKAAPPVRSQAPIRRVPPPPGSGTGTGAGAGTGTGTGAGAATEPAPSEPPVAPQPTPDAKRSTGRAKAKK